MEDMERFLKEFGAYLRALRKERNWTLDDLSEHSGVSKQRLSVMENGHKKPSFESLVKIANAYGMPVAYLFRFQYTASDIVELKKLLRKAIDEAEDNSSPETLFLKLFCVIFENAKLP